jgi:hypothetical protein
MDAAHRGPTPNSLSDSQSRLGGSLLGQKKHADAEPLLRAGYDGI